MNNWADNYAERVRLLVQILPEIAKDDRFALKGAPPSTCSNGPSRDFRSISI